MSDRTSTLRPLAIVVLFGGLAIAAVHYMHRCGEVHARQTADVTLESKHARFLIRRDGRITIETLDGLRKVSAEIVSDDDEVARLVALEDLDAGAPNHASARGSHGAIDFVVDPSLDTLDIDVGAASDDGGTSEDAASSRLGLRIALDGRGVFLAGRGELADLASESGRYAIISDIVHPIGISSGGREMNVDLEPASNDAHATALRATTAEGRASFTIAVSSTTSALWSTLFEHAGVDAKPIKGVVTGASGIAQVVGLDDDGVPQIRVATDVAGRFDFRAPITVTSWFASASATRTSAPVIFPPGTEYDLKLDLSDGGELHVRAFDADTHAPVTARLVVHGIDGTLDPSFGPDYRASGAGPIIDALRGEMTTPLPRGTYRIAATKGIEWSIDTRIVQIDSGKRVDIDLSPRHVVPTPDEIGCDLHVHARPSFDSPVSSEDRVLSLVAAGVDFAIPTEHNLVGNYSPAIKVLGVENEFSFVPGVEVTTYMPKFGHFGVFPYPTDKAPPPYKNTDTQKVFAGARAGDGKRVLVVHHPRLTREIGYFTAFGFKAGSAIPLAMRTDFDALEVYNGYESASLDRVQLVLDDYFALLNAGHRYSATGSSDSHRIQYQWAGYPRTMVRASASDPLAVVAAIKAGQATVTTGPILELVIENVRPGGDLAASSRAVLGKLIVRAAPWIDVTSANVIVGGRVVETFDIKSRPLSTGQEIGSLDEVAARTIRLEAEVRIDIGSSPTWIMATARGSRTLDDILPFMPIQPFAFTNPIFVH